MSMPKGILHFMNIAVFDLETNGITGSSVLSASSLVFDHDGTLLGLFNRFYLPQAQDIDPYAARVHGLTLQRLLALREPLEASSYFLEDWPDLIEFWESWNVEGIVVHNLSFDASFLPEIAQSAFQWWCSMKGLTAYCKIPKRPGNFKGGEKTFKWPRLAEASDIVCNGPESLIPPKNTKRIEECVGEGMAHISLYDCFELYRIISRIATHRFDLLGFASSVVPFRPPKKHIRSAFKGTKVLVARDNVTARILSYERTLQSLVRGNDSFSG